MLIKPQLKKIWLIFACVLVFMPAVLFAERNYVDECDKLPHGEQSAYIKSLNEEELLIMGNQAYIKGWDERSVSYGIIYLGLSHIWETKPPQPETYFPLIKNTQLHSGWRGMLFYSISLEATKWPLSEMFEYIDLGIELLTNPQIDDQLKWRIPNAIQFTLETKIKSVAQKKELSEKDKNILDTLHNKSTDVIKMFTQYLKDKPQGDERTLGDIIYSIDEFRTFYDSRSNSGKSLLSSSSLDKTRKAIQNVYPVFGQVVSQSNYPPRVVIDVLRVSKSNRDALNYIPQSAIENLKNTPAFKSDKDSLNSLEYYSKEIQKKR